MLARDDNNILFSMPRPSSHVAEMEDAAASVAFDSSWRLEYGKCGLERPVSCPTVVGASKVGRYRNECRTIDSRHITRDSTNSPRKC